MLKSESIYVTGSTGFVGNRLIEKLRELGYTRIITSKFDLTNSDMTEEFFRENRPDHVIHLAARVGGIAANRKDNLGFFMDNMKIFMNIFESSVKYRVKKVINFGSSCMFPKDHPIQPMSETELMKGELEPTNLGYALAKIVSQKMGEMANNQTNTKFITLSPCNLYGPGDHIGSEDAHALASIIYKVVTAYLADEPCVMVWGTGDQKREWLHVDDLIDCTIWAMKLEKTETFLNVGSGQDISMNDLAKLVIECLKELVGENQWSIPFNEIEIINDKSKPNGMMRKLVDSSLINSMGWTAKIDLKSGIKETILSYINKGNLVK